MSFKAQLPKWIATSGAGGDQQDPTQETHRKQFWKFCAKKQGQQVLQNGIQVNKSKAKEVMMKKLKGLKVYASGNASKEELCDTILEQIEENVNTNQMKHLCCPGLQYDQDNNVYKLLFKDLNKTRQLFDRTILFLSLVEKVDMDDGKIVAMLKMEISALAMAEHTAKLRLQVLRQLHTSYSNDEKLYSTMLDSTSLEKHEQEWMKLIRETLSLQLDFQKYQEKNELILREMHVEEVQYVKLKDSMQKGGRNSGDSKSMTEEFLARKGQLQQRKKVIDDELNATMEKKFTPLLQAWTLLLQMYYQYLVENMYKKDGNEMHHKEQFTKVSGFMTEWQAEFKNLKVPITFESAFQHIDKLRKELSMWIEGDMANRPTPSPQIVELDSDDSDDDAVEGATGVQTEQFRALHAQISKSEADKEEATLALKNASNKLHRSRQKVEQLGLALLLDYMYGKVFKAYQEDDADRIMKGLLVQEKQNSSSKAKPERNQSSLARNASDTLNSNEQDENEGEEEVDVNHMFKNENVYEMLEKADLASLSIKAKKESKKKKEAKKKQKPANLQQIPNAVEIRMRGYDPRFQDGTFKDKNGKENRTQSVKQTKMKSNKPKKVRNDAENGFSKKEQNQMHKKDSNGKASQQNQKAKESQRVNQKKDQVNHKSARASSHIENGIYPQMEGESARDKRFWKQNNECLRDSPEGKSNTSVQGNIAVNGEHVGGKEAMDISREAQVREHQDKYDYALGRATAALQECKVNTDIPSSMNDVLMQRKRVLRYAMEDSKASWALLKLKAVKECGNADAHPYNEMINAAHEQMKRAEIQYQNFCSMAKLGYRN